MNHKTLIVAATRFELGKTIEHFQLPDQSLMQHGAFDILITGVGMVATAFGMGAHLSPSYNLVINVGIAGSFDTDISLGSLLCIKNDRLAELGAEDHEGFLTIEELGFGNSVYTATADIGDLPQVDAITVNTVHGNSASIELVKSRFKMQIESMEGAAVFYACNGLDIPCAQVRSISNYVTLRNKEEWNIRLAVENLNVWLIQYLTNAIRTNQANNLDT